MAHALLARLGSPVPSPDVLAPADLDAHLVPRMPKRGESEERRVDGPGLGVGEEPLGVLGVGRGPSGGFSRHLLQGRGRASAAACALHRHRRLAEREGQEEGRRTPTLSASAAAFCLASLTDRPEPAARTLQNSTSALKTLSPTSPFHATVHLGSMPCRLKNSYRWNSGESESLSGSSAASVARQLG